MFKSTLRNLSSLLLLLFATPAWAYDYSLPSFSTSDWSASPGWQSCAAYSGAKPCISNGNYFSGDGVSSGDVVFAYASGYFIYKNFSLESGVADGTSNYYISLDAMVGPRNSEQGTKTEELKIVVVRFANMGVSTGSFTETYYITNTSMETYVLDLGVLPTNTVMLQLRIYGKDGGYWAGNYGAVIGNDTVLLSDYDPTAQSSTPTPVYSSGITAAQSTKRTSKLNDTAGHGMEAHVDIDGDNNNVDIRQDNAAHYLELTIVGNSNAIDIDQNDSNGVATHFSDVIIDGNSNTLDLLQTGSGDKTAFIDVDGDDNTVDVIQKDSGQHYLQLDLIGDDHSATIVQEGSGNHDATIELENGGGAWDFNLNQKGTTDKEYSLPHDMSDGSTTSGTCYVAAGCSLTVIQQD